MTPEEQVRLAIATRLIDQIKLDFIGNLETFAGKVAKADGPAVRDMLGDEIVDLCVATNRADWLLDDISKLSINTNYHGDNIVSIVGHDGSKTYRFYKEDLAQISAYLETGKKIQAIKLFREKALQQSCPGLAESKYTCDAYPFTKTF